MKKQPLQHIADPLLSIPPSSAASERIWSAFGKTHTALRNRLSNERIEKLVTIRSNLVLNNSNKKKHKRASININNSDDDTDYSDSE